MMRSHCSKESDVFINIWGSACGVDTSKETVEQFAVRWMETYVATNCTIRTEIGYQGNIDRYIVPAGGGSGSAVYYQSWQQPV